MRWRIAAGIAGTVLLAVAAMAIAVHALVVLDRVNAQRSLAHQRIHAAAEIYDRTGVLSFDAGLDDPRAPRVLRDRVTGDGDWAVLVSGGSTRTVWAAERISGHLLTTRTSFRVASSELRSVDRALALAGGTAIVLALLVGFVVSQGLGRRLRRAARSARSVSAGEDPSSLRSAVGSRRDEVGDLADAVDAMSGRLAERLRGEQRFTADVAHDLRTPVTGLVSAAALLDDSRPAQLVRNRATALATLVEDLLEVARLDRGAEEARIDDVDLARLVSRTVQRGVAAGDYPADVIRLDLESEGPRVMTDSRRLERVLSNLLRNAVRHGRAPIEVTQRGRRLEVHDHGDGFDDTFLSEGPQRFRRGAGSRADGLGLGLVIALAQSQVLGARLRFDNAADGGAVVEVELP